MKNFLLNKFNKRIIMASRRISVKEIESKVDEIRKEMSVIKEDLANMKNFDKSTEIESVKKQMDELSSRLMKAEKNIDEIYAYVHNLYNYLKERLH